MNQATIKNIKPLSIKRQVTFGILALVVLSATILETATQERLASAQTTPATTAAVILDWSVTGSGLPVYTIQYDSINCDAVVGGTSYRRVVSSAPDAVLGTDGSDTTILPTHLNLTPALTDGDNAEQCSYTLKVTANLPCAFTVRMGSSGGTSIGSSLPALTSSSSSPTTATVSISGRAAADDNFFATKVTALGGAAAGNLEYYDSSAVARNVTLANNSVALIINTTSCNSPALVSGFTLTNAEPEGSATLVASVTPRSECRPITDLGDISISPGTAATQRRLILDESCTYSFGVSQDASSSVSAVRAQCEVLGVIYERDTNNNLTVLIRRSSDNDLSLRLAPGTTLRVARTSQTNKYIVHVTLLLSNTCPRTKTIKVQYEVTDASTLALRNSAIQVRITRAANANASCIAIPSTVTLTAASVERTATDNSKEVVLVERPVLGRTCSYVFSYPRTSGALTLAAEPGNNFRAGAGTSTTIARPLANAITNSDSALDGQYSSSVTVLSETVPLSFIYEARKIPINVSTTFPSDINFTTDEIVSYRISLIDECARYSAIVARALGGEGTFRTIQAYPGDTLVFSPALQELVSSTSQAGSSLVELNPVVVINGRNVSCKVQVAEVGTPEGCEVIGVNPKVAEFGEGLREFSFNFNHVCSGRTTLTTSVRGITG